MNILSNIIYLDLNVFKLNVLCFILNIMYLYLFSIKYADIYFSCSIFYQCT